MSRDFTKLAFPVVTNDPFERGMTLREYFAGQALIGLSRDMGRTVQDDAELCVLMADALIAELAK